MSSKRKWDQPGPLEDDHSKPKSEDKTASEAAAAAAAIAAKIAAQFAGGTLGASGLKDQHDGDFVKDIDINDVRNRYMLTKGSTQQQVSPWFSKSKYYFPFHVFLLRIMKKRVHL